MKAGLVIAGCILAATNFVLFILLLGGLSPVPPAGGADATYDAISTQITILSVLLTAVALGLAAAAFFGYQALERVMLRRADELWNERQEHLEQTQPPDSGGPGPSPPAQAEEEKNL